MVGEWSDRRLLSYGTSRPELVRILPRTTGPVLDVGCSGGELGGALKRIWGPDLVVWGIEIDVDLARSAEGLLDRVIVGDAAASVRELVSTDFQPSLVVFADVLEHLYDPWSVLDDAVDLVGPGGFIAASIPNVAHLDTFLHLAMGRWPYRDRGIHDDTHIRHFARRNVVELMNRSSAQLVRLERIYRLVDRATPFDRFARLVAWLWRDLFTYQYLAVSRVGE